jgi:hypothetical protein
MIGIHQIALQLRQLTYPEEFRIAVGPASVWSTRLASAINQALHPPQSPPAPSHEKPDAQIDRDFATRLCNRYFHVRRAVRDLVGASGSSDAAEDCTDSLAFLDDELAKHGIECLDLTGERFMEGRRDFEILGKPEAVAGIPYPRIGRLERPAVKLGGKLIQSAVGIVERPS